MPREVWSSRFGFILALVAGMVGIGNLWRFPYLMGIGGGAAFLVIYVIILVLLGFAGMSYELTLGKISKGGPITACEFSGIPGGKYLGAVPIILYFIMATYYMVVVGWVVKYFTLSFTDVFATADLSAYFGNFAFADPQRFLFHAIAIAIGAAVMIFGVVKGFERTCKVAVPIFVILLIVVAIKGMTLPGAGAGLHFLFSPDWSKVTLQTVVLALGQVFFTIGLCTAVLVTLGSYMKENEDVPLNSIISVLGDSIVAVIAALAIFPALFAFGITEPESGPALIFIMFPAVLKELPHIFGIVFFFAAALVVLTTAAFILQFLAEPFITRWHWSQRKAILIAALVVWVCGLPAAYNLDWLMGIDLYFSSVFLPLAAIIAPVALLWYIGRDRAKEWANKGASFRVGNWWVEWGRYGYPILVFLILVFGVLAMLGVF